MSRKGSTNFFKVKYSEIVDFNTESGMTTVVGFHTPITTLSDESPTGYSNINSPPTLLTHIWSSFRYVKYGGMDVKIAPAAQLPADPLQVSYEAGEATIDPRDLLNPITFHGTMGDSLNSSMNKIFNESLSVYNYTDGSRNPIDTNSMRFMSDQMGTTSPGFTTNYYGTLVDKAWRKYSQQSTFRLPHMSPRVWSVDALRPTPGSILGTGDSTPINSTDGLEGGDGATGTLDSTTSSAYNTIYNGYFATKSHPLGWMPTHSFSSSTATSVGAQGLPKLYMGIMMLPPSYKQEMYMRAVVTHTFMFRDFVMGISPFYYQSPCYSQVSLPNSESTIESIDSSEPTATTSITVANDDSEVEVQPTVSQVVGGV